ncbi:hypothetical protein FUAX_22550 [Fulvitalea axinellae]|uniref:Prepilin type IV endopeptidase peptidase domain-containing protein n=1 Tax=Fulvitalea axinellae TaxID=1182444 RepID=A0AAU9CIE0_9BACT|nr:hypothetical protein FUAX_22550 [Fulvitalea axinellae]
MNFFEFLSKLTDPVGQGAVFILIMVLILLITKFHDVKFLFYSSNIYMGWVVVGLLCAIPNSVSWGYFFMELGVLTFALAMLFFLWWLSEKVALCFNLQPNIYRDMGYPFYAFLPLYAWFFTSVGVGVVKGVWFLVAG